MSTEKIRITEEKSHIDERGARFDTVSIRERELSSVLVYSSARHVDYINLLLSLLEPVLRGSNLNPQRLGDEIRSGEDYLEKIEKMIDDCVLGVVILDGFRPNVIFEFGMLRGKRKPIIVLQSNDAYINIKTLYSSRKEAGLSKGEFRKLRHPKIVISRHLSDFAGKHIAFFDWRVEESDSRHLVVVLKEELKKNMRQIMEETEKVKTRDIPPEYRQEFLEPLIKVIRYYYADVSECDVEELKSSYDQINLIAQKHVFQIPYEVFSMIAATFTLKAEEIKHNVVMSIDCFEFAIKIYREIIKSIHPEESSHIYADINIKIGNIHVDIAEIVNKAENSRKAIIAYKEALKVRTFDRFPIDFAMTQNNLGNAYWVLAEVEDKAENCRKAIDAFNEALRVNTFDDYPMQYATTQNNLGTAYGVLAEVEDKAENCRKAIEALNEALRVYTEDYPVPHELVKKNLEKAIEFCQRDKKSE